MVKLLLWWLGGRELSPHFDKDFRVSPGRIEGCLCTSLAMRDEYHFPHQTHPHSIDKCVVYYKIRMLVLMEIELCPRCTGGF